MNLVDLIGILPTIFSIILAGLENMKIIGQARFYWSDQPDCDLWQAGQPDREDGEDNEVLAHLQDDSPLCRAPKPFLHLAPGAFPCPVAPVVNSHCSGGGSYLVNILCRPGMSLAWSFWLCSSQFSSSQASYSTLSRTAWILRDGEKYKTLPSL